MYAMRLMFLRAWAVMALTGLVVEAFVSLAFAASSARTPPRQIEPTVSESTETVGAEVEGGAS